MFKDIILVFENINKNLINKNKLPVYVKCFTLFDVNSFHGFAKNDRNFNKPF